MPSLSVDQASSSSGGSRASGGRRARGSSQKGKSPRKDSPKDANSSSAPQSQPSPSSSAEKEEESDSMLSDERAKNLQDEIRQVEHVLNTIAAEHLSPTQSVELILKESVDVQRVAMFDQLSHYIGGATLPEVGSTLVAALKAMPHHSVAVQTSCAKGIEPVYQTLLAPDREQVFLAVFELVCTAVVSGTRDAWSQSLLKLVWSLGNDNVGILEGVVHTAANMEEPLLRTVAVTLTATAVEQYSQLALELIPPICPLFRDPDVGVRKQVALSFGALARALGQPLTREGLVTQLFGLLLDADSSVSSTAFRSLVSLLQWFSADYIQTLLFPVVMEYTTSPPETTLNTVIEVYGEMIWSLKDFVVRNNYVERVVSQFQTASESQDVELRRCCAFNFMGIALSFGLEAYMEHLHNIVVRMSQDTSSDVRATIAAIFHHLCEFLGENATQFLHSMFIALLNDSEISVQHKLMTQLGTTLNVFARLTRPEDRHKFFLSVAAALVKYEQRIRTNWRTVDTLLNHFVTLQRHYTLIELHKYFIPILQYHLEKGAAALKGRCAQILVNFLKGFTSEQDKLVVVESFRWICADLGQGKSLYSRMAFCDVCGHALTQFSRRFFSVVLLSTLKALAKDSFSNVRRRVAMLVSAVGAVVGQQNVADVVGLLEGDSSVDVRAALRVGKIIAKRRTEAEEEEILETEGDLADVAQLELHGSESVSGGRMSQAERWMNLKAAVNKSSSKGSLANSSLAMGRHHGTTHMPVPHLDPVRKGSSGSMASSVSGISGASGAGPTLTRTSPRKSANPSKKSSRSHTSSSRRKNSDDF